MIALFCIARHLNSALLLFTACYCGLSITTAHCQTAAPNVLWIVSDDLGVELSCYGEKAVATPNIDRLASEGVRYTRAFATAPVCSSSRTAFITGIYQTSIGGHHHRTRSLQPLANGIKTVGEYFKDAGYHVTNASGQPGKKAKMDYNFQNKSDLYNSSDWSKRRAGQPFFSQLQIHEPHRKFVKNLDPDRADKITLPPYYPDHPVTRADWANYLSSVEELDRKVGLELDRLDKDGLSENTIVFFFGDHGRPHLRGKQWLYEGGIHIPLIIRWPGKLPAGKVDNKMISMIDFAPSSLAAAGLNVPSTMQGSNIFDRDFKGHQFIFAARDRCGDAVDRIRCVRSERFKYIRNFMPDTPYTVYSGYKKLQYPVGTLMNVLNDQNRLSPEQKLFMAPSRPEEELYDLKADPFELNNLASAPAHSGTLNILRDELDRWIEETGDLGRLKEGDETYMNALMSEKKAYYDKTMKRRGLNPDISDRDYLEWWKNQLGVN